MIDTFQKHFNDTVLLNNVLHSGNYLAAYLITISDIISNYQGSTIEDLFSTIEKLSNNLLSQIINAKTFLKTRTALSLKAVNELMLALLHKYASTRLGEDYIALKDKLVHIIKDLFDLCIHSKETIYKMFSVSIKNNATILCHGYSSTVAFCLIRARKSGKKFKVLVSKSINSLGNEMCEQLTKNDIEAKVIDDSAVGYYMKDVDFVVVGADVVCENGGIINKIGTFTIAIVANSFKKPLYVLSDSLKFIKMFPISQEDVQQSFKKFNFNNKKNEDNNEIEISCDYTPPEFIDFFFTDIGILTPSAVNDEFIQVFYT